MSVSVSESTSASPAVPCTHLDEIQSVTVHAHVCEDCLKLGDTWVHLRVCLECGYVGCCDSSKNTHATKHFHASQHPVIQTIQPGEDWLWCYVDQVMMEPGERLYRDESTHRH